MKVCIVTPSIDKRDGGPSRSVPILSKGLAEIGIKTTLLTIESDQMNDGILVNSNVSLVKLGKNESTHLKTILSQNNFDILHIQNLWLPFVHWAASAARKLNIPYIMTPRGMLEPWSLEQKKLKKTLALKLYQKKDLNKAACILATSDMEANHIKELGITAPVAIIPNGIDLTNYPCRPTIKNIKKQILFLSRIHQKKGIEILIQAWKEISHKFPDWEIIVAGNGDNSYISTLNDKIKEAELTHSMKIIPPVFGEDKYKLYSESAIFILPSYSENFGMVIAEAMSCGVPVITTKGTPWEILNKEDMGWWIDLSVENISLTLERAILTGMNNLYNKGQRSSLYIRNNYQYEQVSMKNEELYNWILGKTKKPDFVV